MKFTKSDLGQRFAELSARERGMAVAGAIAVLFYSAYLLFYQPIDQQNRLLSQKIQSQRQTLQYLQRLADEVAVLRRQMPADTPEPAVEPQSPLATLDGSSQQLGLKPAIKRLSPEGDDKAWLWLENLPFDRLVEWLAELETRHRLQVLQIDVEKQAGAGIVNAKILLGV